MFLHFVFELLLLAGCCGQLKQGRCQLQCLPADNVTNLVDPAARLVAAKERYDPEHVFTAIPLPDRDLLEAFATSK